MNASDSGGVPYAFEKLTVTNASKTFTESVYGTPPNGNRPKEAVVSVLVDAINIRQDGTAPDATTGIRAAVNTTVNIKGEAAIRATKMWKVTNDATINVQYYY